MKNIITAFVILIVQISIAQAQNYQNISNEHILNKFQQNDKFFEENIGQIRDEFNCQRKDVLFTGFTSEMQLISRANGYSYQLRNKRNNDNSSNKNVNSIEISRVDLNWIGANKNTHIEFSDMFADYTNYYNLANENKGFAKVRKFGAAKIINVYDGINVKYHFNNGQIEYDYEIAPGADYKKIRIEINGAKSSLNKNGEIVIETAMGQIIESAPKVYQNGKLLNAEWLQLENNIWTFQISNYSPEFALLIDPIIRVWSTYFTGNNYDYLYSVSSDAQNNIYAAGSSSSNNIATAGAFNSVLQGDFDGIISKFDESGNRLWTTYLGGSNQDNIHKITTKPNGQFLVCGQTRSNNFYTSNNSFQDTYVAGWDGFLSSFNGDGTNNWSTLIGGNNDDFAYSIDFSNENIYVCGTTSSINNIATNNVHQSTQGGANGTEDAFLMKFTINGSRIFGTYFGGENNDNGLDVKVNQMGDIFLIGYTESQNNISTTNSHQNLFGGGNRDGYFAKFDSTGSRIFASYFGGSGIDIGRSIVFDSNDNFIISGETSSSNNIATPSSQQSIFGGGASDVYLTKFSPSGQLIWSTYFGSEGNDYLSGTNEGLFVDDNGNIFLIGNTSSNTNIATSGAYQEFFNGGLNDGFISNYFANGTINFSTYYGGLDYDLNYGATLLPGGSFILVGETQSAGFYATPNCFQNQLQGTGNGYISKFSYCLNTIESLTISSCDGYEDINGEMLTESGIYTYTLLNSTGCDSTIVLDLTIQTDASSSTNLTICNEQLPFNWNGLTFNGAGNQTATLISLAGCDSLAALNLTVLNQLSSTTNITVCPAQLPYLWNGVTFNAAGSQSVTLTSISGCDSIAILNLDVENQITSTSNLAICDSQLPFIWNGITFNGAGYQSSTLTNSAGCDSIATLNLSVNSFVPYTDIQLACSSFTWIDGNTYSSSTNSPTFTITGGSAAGCDSVITLNLTVTQNTGSLQNVSSCDRYVSETGEIYTEDTIFYYTLSAENGCDSIVTVNLTITSLPIVNASASSLSIFKGDSVQLNANGALNYLWTPSDFLFCDTCATTFATPIETVTYILTGTDTWGCSSSDTIEIKVDVKCNDPFIPTIFSPNGKGPASNEMLCLFSNCVDEFRFVIYNRWGQQVFETTDVTKCWDGFFNDTEAISGVYAYNLYLRQLDGTVLNKKGMITLVR